MTVDAKRFGQSHSETAGEAAMEPADRGASPGRIGALEVRWYSVPEAARLLGISEVAVRKRLACGSLSGVRAGRSWRVLLTGAQDVPAEADKEAPPPPVAAPEVQALVQVSQSLEAVIRDLQRQNLALAGQIGYLQSQLHAAQAQIAELRQADSEVRQLQAAEAPPAADEAVAAPEDQAVSPSHPESVPAEPAEAPVAEAAEPASDPVPPEQTARMPAPPKRRWWRKLF